ncbi:type I pullulanase [Algisphaera agarilytica]|uniref:pullulanase n=1 Tax=Algisphaera agarilytica TaxID=1385975 RepID=A0A7X0LJ23_9BACT|nr:type I pullulanase [Algisphaera agarilytica]MBB6428402.1 pullulanase [Algisphaera agarilytica]
MPATPKRLSHLPRLLALLGTVVTATLSQAAPPAERLAERIKPADLDAQSVLILHYHRPDGDYDRWNAWVWTDSGEGKSYAFEQETDFGRVAIIPVDHHPDRYGFIVRRGNWVLKDIDRDRFVSPDKTNTKRRVTEVWVNSGDPEVYVDGQAIDLSPKLIAAFLDSPKQLALASTTPLKSRDLIEAVLQTEAGDIALGSIQRSKTPSPGSVAYTVRLKSEVDAASLNAPLTLAIPDYDPMTVYARAVLDDPSLAPLDVELGPVTNAEQTTFTTWSPVASSVDLLIYEDGIDSKPSQTLALERKSDHGVWQATVAGDLHNVPYQFRFTSYGQQRTVADIHCKAALPGSDFSVAVDLDRTNPEGWDTHQPPRLAQPTDEVIYEIHVRDFSMTDPNTPEHHKGKYLGLITPGVTEPGEESVTTGIAHLKELGVTAVHLLPIHDFGNDRHNYNWGYWTSLFNVPESDYSTTPDDPANTIRELKTAIKVLQDSDIRVILDVVYNHTSSSFEYSPFDQTIPNYFFRTNPDGSLRNDAGVGNSVADERLMVRKYIVDSLKYWVTEYKIDGVRFDLLGTHHPETVQNISDELYALRPDLTIYGEPWTGGGPIYFGKGAQRGMGVAVFNDHLRNAVRGDLDGTATGFATGPNGDTHAIRNGVAGAIDDFSDSPTESINYVSAHDNRTLWDKIEYTHPNASEEEKRAMHKLSLGIVLTSQGIPFLHGGVDMARTKGGHHNSYNQGDEVNAFGWDRKEQYRDVHEYVAGLIELRREHPALRLTTRAQVRNNLKFLKNTPEGVVAYTLNGQNVGDDWDKILIIYNGQPTAESVKLPPAAWRVVVDAHTAGTETLAEARGNQELPPYSMMVLHQ